MNQISPYLKPQQEPEAKEAFSPVPVTYTPPATISEHEKWTVKEIIAYSLLATIGIGGTIWLGSKLIKKKIANNEENKSFEDGTPATTAKQIKMAFENDGWWGTNVPALRDALVNVSSQDDWDKTVKSYNKLFNSNLLKDMSDELQSSEYNEMMQIINAKPRKKGQAPQVNQFRAWAKRLKAAFDKEYGFFGGTDEKAIIATFNEMPTQHAFIYTGIEYKKLYGTNLIDDLKSESEFGEYADWMAIIIKKPKI